VIDATHLSQLTPQQLRETVLSLAGTLASCVFQPIVDGVSG
jgi:hypothetical protein